MSGLCQLPSGVCCGAQVDVCFIYDVGDDGATRRGATACRREGASGRPRPRHVRWRHGRAAVCGEAARAGRGDDDPPSPGPPNDLLRLGGLSAALTFTSLIITLIVSQEP